MWEFIGEIAFNLVAELLFAQFKINEECSELSPDLGWIIVPLIFLLMLVLYWIC